MVTVIVIIIILAVLFQLAAAILAIRLIKLTMRRFAWLLIAFGITLMTFRRIQSLVLLLSSGYVKQSELVFEIIGLIISISLFAGIYLIKPLFLSMVRAEEEREKLIAELKDALASIKTLKGMLPICASCKKIRDDKGYWSQIEAYVHEHSEAEFTHAICPECARRLYPDYCPAEEK
jgi:hypothetical protein